MADFGKYKQMVLDTTLKLVDRGLMTATGGNVSVLIDGADMVAVTPSSKDYTQMCADDVCVCDFDRKIVEGEFAPSVETGMHISLYKARPDVSAVVHTHQVYASIFSLIQSPIPALFDEQVVNLGKEVAFVPYGLSGSPDLLKNITAAAANKCCAYILQNHGAIVMATDLDQAARNAMILEKVAQVYYLALTSGRELTPLPQQMADMLVFLLDGKQKAETKRKEKLKQDAGA